MREHAFAFRGVIEGFYGPMWSHQERLHLLRHMPSWHMNLYIYSARNDPYHRFQWEVPYPPAQMERFRELAEEADRQGVQFAWAISPGNTFDADRSEHREALVEKLRPFIELGCTFFPIFYDDLTEEFDPDAEEGVRHAQMQARVMNDLADSITAICPDAAFLFCPTQYMTAEKSRYLCRLHELLAPRIQTVVTGVDPASDGVCPRRISDEGARRYLENFGRRPFVWDNFNVRDNSLNVLHWSPYSGRGDHLGEICAGIVLNPQNVYLLNLPIFGCMGDYLADPLSYDPGESFRRHVTEFMGEEAAPLGVTLSRWFTSEWFASPGSGYLSSEQNLPSIPPGRDGPRDLEQCLGELRRVLSPLRDFEDRFIRTLMPPRVAGHLAPYAHILTEYARAMVEFCQRAEGCREIPESGIAELLEQVDRPRTECYRLPESLIQYAKRLAASLS